VTARSRVAVVGGGISGLAAAWELSSSPGVDVVVLEAGPRLGGKIRTSGFAGRQVDEGADTFLRRVPEGLQLADELGLGDSLVSPAVGTALVWAHGALHPLPAGHVLGVPVDADALAASGVVSPAAVEAARREPSLPGAPLTRDESLGSLVRRRFGDEILELLVEPLVGGINAGEADELSVDAVVPQIAAAARRSASLVEGLRAAPPTSAVGAAPEASDGPVFAAPLGGMGTLVEELAAALTARGADLRVEAPVEGLVRHTDGWLLHGRGEDLAVDAVVVATPAPVAAGLVRPLAPTAADLLAGIDHASVVMVTLAVPVADLPHGLAATGVLVPRHAGLAVTAVSFASTKWAHLADPETAILRVSAGHRADPRPVDLADADLLELVRRDLATLLGSELRPDAHRISRYPAGFPQYDVGHLDRVAAVEGILRDAAPGVVVTGAALRGLGIPSCIRQGRTAAHHALAGTGASR
jgi:oxygen-dependent protoporphyrinogen oxidase